MKWGSAFPSPKLGEGGGTPDEVVCIYCHPRLDCLNRLRGDPESQDPGIRQDDSRNTTTSP